MFSPARAGFRSPPDHRVSPCGLGAKEAGEHAQWLRAAGQCDDHLAGAPEPSASERRTASDGMKLMEPKASLGPKPLEPA